MPQEADMQAAYALFSRVCSSTSRSMKTLRWIAVAMLIGIALTLATTHFQNPGGLIGLSFAALYFIFGLPWQVKRGIRKTFLGMAAPNTTLPITITCDEEQISFALLNKSEAKFFWSGVMGSAEDDHVFLLIPVKRMFYYIPKRALSEESLKTLRALAPGKPSSC